MFGRYLAVFVSVALASVSIPAAAQQPSGPGAEEEATRKRAEELFTNGKQLFKEGSYEAAILAFTESYELTKAPALLYNIGNSYERLGDFANARKYLDQYRAFAPEKERETLARRIQNIDQRLREQEEKEKAERDKQPPPDPNPDATKPEPAEPATEPVTEPPPVKERGVFGALEGTFTGLAVVGLGLGIGFGVSAEKQRKEALSHCAQAGQNTFCNVEAEDGISKQRGWALGADISFAVAGVAAITVIALVAVRMNKKKNLSRASLAPVVGTRGAGLSFGLRF